MAISDGLLLVNPRDMTWRSASILDMPTGIFASNRSLTWSGEPRKRYLFVLDGLVERLEQPGPKQLRPNSKYKTTRIRFHPNISLHLPSAMHWQLVLCCSTIDWTM
jgi:hypothetical protein